MLRRKLTKWTLAAGVAVAALALNVRTSDAHFGRHGGGSWGSSGGSWGSSGGSSGGSWGSSGGYYYGSSGGSWGSSGGSSGGWGHHSWGSSGGSWGSSGGYSYWGSSGGSSGGYYWGSSGGSSGGTVIYDGGAPSMPAAPGGSTNPTPAPGPSSDAPPTPMPTTMYRSMNGSQTAMLNVSVPSDAKVFVNGAATTSTGNDRQFVSRGLNAGNKYAYEVRAEYEQDGKTVTQTKSVTLGPGEFANLAFNANGNESAPVAAGKNVKTKVTLHVPADAKVYLSGRETTSTGDVREFATSKLAPGAEWKNYTVRVVANIDGRDVSKEETITLTGGENKDLSFDFNTNAVASTAAVTR